MKKVYLLSGLCLAVWCHGAAGATCKLTDNEDTCQVKIEEAVEREQSDKDAGASDKATIAAAGDTIARRSSGNNAAIPQTANSTVNDFLSRFQFALDMGELDEDSEALTFELARFLPAVDGLKLTTTLQAGKAYEPLVEAAPADVQESVRSALDRRLGDFDDVRISFSYSLSNKRFGRNPQHHSALLSKILRSSRDKTRKVEVDRIRDDYDNAKNAGLDKLGLPRNTATETKTFDSYGAADGTAILAAFETTARAELGDIANLLADLHSSGFYTLADLIDNQPQFYVTAQIAQRDELAGPDEFKLRFAYEMGLHNMNGLRRHAKDDSDCNSTDKLDEVKNLTKCIDSYVGSIGSIDSGRFVFAGEYLRRQSYGIALTDPVMLDLSLPSHSEIKVNLAYGRYLSILGDETGDGRFDIGISYVDVKDDPMRNDRAFAEVTYSQRVSDSSYLTIGFVYSNKPEFRGEVDKELSARMGLSYKVPKFGAN